MEEFKKCPFCNIDAKVNEQPSYCFSFLTVDCPSCGHFAIDKFSFKSSKSSKSFNQKMREKAAMIAAERKLKGEEYEYFFVQNFDKVEEVVNSQYHPITLKDFLREYPQTGADVFDRVLLNFSRLCPAVHEFLDLAFYDDSSIEAYKWYFYSPRVEGVEQIVSELKSMGFLNVQGKWHWHITRRGWERIDKLQESEGSAPFVAMWFNSKETGLLRESIKKAVKSAGYSALNVMVDEAHHNDFIMDKVLNMINEARFVIADFTCQPELDDEKEKISQGVRGGVYFEAGYARGLGKKVIHTCRDDDESKKRRHFDIDQINTIFWQEKDDGLKVGKHDFEEILKERIIRTVGKGPLAVINPASKYVTHYYAAA